MTEMFFQVQVTAIYAGLHGLLAVLLANFVLFVRVRGRKMPEWQADAALRVQANFVENVPIALVLLLVLEQLVKVLMVVVVLILMVLVQVVVELVLLVEIMVTQLA